MIDPEVQAQLEEMGARISALEEIIQAMIAAGGEAQKRPSPEEQHLAFVERSKGRRRL